MAPLKSLLTFLQQESLMIVKERLCRYVFGTSSLYYHYSFPIVQRKGFFCSLPPTQYWYSSQTIHLSQLRVALSIHCIRSAFHEEFNMYINLTSTHIQPPITPLALLLLNNTSLPFLPTFLIPYLHKKCMHIR